MEKKNTKPAPSDKDMKSPALEMIERAEKANRQAEINMQELDKKIAKLEALKVEQALSGKSWKVEEEKTEDKMSDREYANAWIRGKIR